MTIPGWRQRVRLDPERRRTALTFGVWILVLASVVSWRRGVLYSGGLDATVLAKAFVAALAAVAAVVLWRSAPIRRRLSPFPPLLVLSIVGISVVGAMSTGNAVASAVLAVRIALLSVTVLMLLSSMKSGEAVASLLTAMAVLGLVAAVTGVPGIHHSGVQAGRLGGGIPPLEPNELATLLLPPAIGLTYFVVRRGVKSLALVGLVVLAAVIYLTGSRAALAMLVVASVVTIITARRISRTAVAVALVAAVVAYAAVAFTPVLSTLLLRGEGVQRLLTLNSRTISWGAVFALPKNQWSWWLGHGLSMKTIRVTGQYWSNQAFDSSWISSIAQDGVIGTILLAIYAAGTLVAVWIRRDLRPWALPLVLAILIRSSVENGLIESSVAYTLCFLIATAAWPGTAARPARAVPAVQAPAALPEEPRVLAYPASWLSDRDASPSARPITRRRGLPPARDGVVRSIRLVVAGPESPLAVGSSWLLRHAARLRPLARDEEAPDRL